MTKRSGGPWACTITVAFSLLPLLIGQGCPPPVDPDPPEEEAEVQNVTPTEAQALIQSHLGDPSFVILDVRTPEEFATGHIENAVSLCVNCESPVFGDEIAGMDKSKTYLVHCGVGGRSATATGIMLQAGFTNVYNMPGGITQWQADGLPVVQ